MVSIERGDIKYNHYFDKKTKRHFLNGIQSVFHCHHYTCLYTQLAIDADETELLKDCARESFGKSLQDYFNANLDLDTIQKKVEIAAKYYALIGLGTMVVNFLGYDSGEVELLSSHTDSGWIKKWGKTNKPVNYITAGFIEAMFDIILNQTLKTFLAIEQKSIVSGAKTSLFKVVRR
jgi:hypothetical protein